MAVDQLPSEKSASPITVWKQLFVLIESLTLGAIAGALWAAIPTMFPTYTPAGGTPQKLFELLALVPWGAVALMLPASLLFGLPTFFLLKRLRLFNFVSVALVSVLASLVVAEILLEPISLPGDLWRLCWLCSVGPVSGLVAFPLIRHDQDHPDSKNRNKEIPN
jgi:hypothetical protein